MDDFNVTPELDVSQLSAVALQRIGILVAQVRVVYERPVRTIAPKADSAFPNVWRLLGFIEEKGRFIYLSLKYDDRTGKLAVLGVDIADDLDELRDYLCQT